MKSAPIVALGLLLVVCVPARAEWAVFDGRFHTYFACVSPACDGDVAEPVNVPYSFAVELPRFRVSHEVSRSSSTHFFAPAAALPQRLLDEIRVTPDAFFREERRNNSVGHRYVTLNAQNSLTWDFESSQRWSGTTTGSDPNNAPASSYQWNAGLRVVLRQPQSITPEQMRQPVSFEQLLAFMQGYVDRAEVFPVYGSVNYIDAVNGVRFNRFSKSLDGNFRLTGITCKAPSGLSVLFGALRGG